MQLLFGSLGHIKVVEECLIFCMLWMGNTWLFAKDSLKRKLTLVLSICVVSNRGNTSHYFFPGRTTQKPSIHIVLEKQHFLKQIIPKLFLSTQERILRTCYSILWCSSTRSLQVIWDDFASNLWHFEKISQPLNFVEKIMLRRHIVALQ